MKIDFAALRALVASGISAGAIVDYLEDREQEYAPKRTKRTADRRRQRATSGDMKRQMATSGDIGRQAATVSDTPRARLFRECVPALVALNLKESRARSLIAAWLKETRDDDQLVTATVLRAKSLNVADAPGWILAALQQSTGKRNGQRTSSVGNAFDDLIARAEGEPSQDGFEPADDLRVVSP